MSNEHQKVPVNYIERTIAQADVVEKLALQQKSAPNVEAGTQLEIEMEKLAFFQNAATGNPKGRAQKVSDAARSSVLAKAVTQPLPKLN
ncbi:MAG TPA: hypothetical protein VK612_12480 [Pyrinomonadaceae bacterium]|nr:hypothetical protein [Pyrinomonadaceae bacterium]